MECTGRRRSSLFLVSMYYKSFMHAATSHGFRSEFDGMMVLNKFVKAVGSQLVLICLFVTLAACQFPASCNTPENLDTKTCCPSDCGGASRGSCVNVTEDVVEQWERANSTIVGLLRNTPNEPQKGTADARYLWPTVVFENVCICNGNYGGFDCTECDFGWMGENCQTRKTNVRQRFASLSESEKSDFIEATRQLKSEIGVYCVIVGEPKNYSVGTVTLQNVSTYNFLIFFHDFSARDENECSDANRNNTINFAHFGPAFPVWHRRYMLTVEKEFQRILNNPEFGFPYWQWEENDRSPFTLDYFGEPSNSISLIPTDVTGTLFDDWNTVCDLVYFDSSLSCSDYWKPCNPAKDLAEKRKLQRGGGTTYLPNRIEVMIALAAPSYDAANDEGYFSIDAPRTSFRSRLEGWNNICSAANCVGTTGTADNPTFSCRMHNNVHNWIGGQMDIIPAAVNDPIFNLHHCNVDRIFESWINRFGQDDPLNAKLLPSYVPVSEAHPGQNLDDYLVPFFPLVRVSTQYQSAEEWGYSYDSLIAAEIEDDTIMDCEVLPPDTCPICRANGSCVNCTEQSICPLPTTEPQTITGAVQPQNDNFGVEVGLEVGLGVPLDFCVVIIVTMITLLLKLINSNTEINLNEMTVRTYIASLIIVKEIESTI